LLVAVLCALLLIVSNGSRAASGDPYCTGSYGGPPPRAAGALRLGVDPGLAGSAGGQQLPSAPDDPARDLAEVKALAPPGRQLVVRLNRLFWSDGQAGIDAFKREVARYTGAGFEVELQVRYHPASGDAGNIPAWVAYIRHIVDSFGWDRRVVAMTITNEVNFQGSPNTSDGYYSGAEDALIQGIEAAYAEAHHKGYGQLRFGFTYAYRFSPQGDASFFSYLGAHGGPALQRALGLIGLDFYPGTVYPPAMAPGDSYGAELARAAGTVRECFAPMAGIARAVPIWITENGIPTGILSEAQQAAALSELVRAAHDYSGTFNITDYRWFNLRDASSSAPQSLIGPAFSSDGLLRADYSPKPSFGSYRALIAALGARAAPPPAGCPGRSSGRARGPGARRRPCGRSRAPSRRSSGRRQPGSPRPDRR
jgi:hypothetical protein